MNKEELELLKKVANLRSIVSVSSADFREATALASMGYLRFIKDTSKNGFPPGHIEYRKSYQITPLGLSKLKEE